MWSKKQNGVSLLEVLAAIFVISIGLLGVLAVIPFGAYQVSQAKHAEHASNMLANACAEVFIRKLTHTASWDSQPNGTKFVWYEPYDMEVPDHHIERIGNFLTFTPELQKIMQEVMRGQDDLVYTSYDDKRPDAGKAEKIQSSGKYTWFFTFLPKPDEDKVGVDVLACFHRIPDDDVQVPPDDFVPSSSGGTLTFSDVGLADRLTQTRYVFVTWEESSQLKGTWCKIVFLDKLSLKVVVTGNLPRGVYDNMYVYIAGGILYHKRLENVPVE